MTFFRALMTPQWVSILGGWRALGFASLALCAFVWGGWQRAHVAGLRVELAESRVTVAQLRQYAEGMRLAAEDYEARAKQARADLADATKALERQSAARAGKWRRIGEQERAWAETPVPDAVVEGLR